MILLSPDTIFDQLYNVDQVFCKDEFYNSVNSSEVFNCKACDCNNPNNNRAAMGVTGPPNYPKSIWYNPICNKRTGECYPAGCYGKLIATPLFRRGNIEKTDTKGFSQHWLIKMGTRKDRSRTVYIKVVGTCCWEIADRHGETQEFRPGEEKEPKIWYIKTIKTKKCA